jgi:hypothetical protein
MRGTSTALISKEAFPIVLKTFHHLVLRFKNKQDSLVEGVAFVIHRVAIFETAFALFRLPPRTNFSPTNNPWRTPMNLFLPHLPRVSPVKPKHLVTT